MKKLLAITLSVCMMICALSISAFAASEAYDDLDTAAAALGLTPLGDKVLQDSIYGSSGSTNEECYNLFDDDVTTKFGTGTFPIYAAWQMDKAYSIGGIIFATANDNASYTGRNAETWTLLGSHDDNTWVELASGTVDDFEDTNWMYYTVTLDKATEAYEYFMFEVPNPLNGAFFQLAELILCEADASAAPAEEPPAEEPPAEEPPAEEPPAEEPPAEVEVAPVETDATTSPITSDYTVMITVAASIIALAALVVLKKKALR